MKLKFLYFLLIFTIVSCSSTDKKDSDSPEALFEKAKQLEKDDRLEEAIKKYGDVKNKFPYSKLATQSELAIGDAYFKQESFPESQAAYLTFRELHPKHPQITYVIFRIGLSIFNQLPDSIDRDLTVANQAIVAFDEVIKNDPTSEFVSDAKIKKDACLKMLAEKEVYIANFYYKKGHFDTAYRRYQQSYNKNGIAGFNKESLQFALNTTEKLDIAQVDLAMKEVFKTKLREKQEAGEEKAK